MTSSNEFDIPDNIKYVKEGPFFYDACDGATFPDARSITNGKGLAR